MVMSSSKAALFPVVLLVLAFPLASSLSTNFYSETCPHVFDVIKPVVEAAIAKEARVGASLLRLFFHDCFVNGCDASILLDDTGSFTGEKTSPANKNSVRGFEVVDEIKAAVEKACPGVVSCSDILAIASRDSVNILGGPTWKVKLGRKDATTVIPSLASTGLPPPFFNLSNLILSFNSVGLSTKDVVVLSGGHTIGKARCTTFRAHIYNDTNIDSSFAAQRQSNCPRTAGSGDNNLAPIDLNTPTVFDNAYYKNLVHHKGLFHSDQELFNGGATDKLVKKYSKNEKQFFKDFAVSMVRMGNIQQSLTTSLEVRKNCRRVN